MHGGGAVTHLAYGLVMAGCIAFFITVYLTKA
jgi:hypothetical protein